MAHLDFEWVREQGFGAVRRHCLGDLGSFGAPISCLKDQFTNLLLNP